MNILVVGQTAVEYWAYRMLGSSRYCEEEPPVRQRLAQWGLATARIGQAPRSAPSDEAVDRVRRELLGPVSLPVSLLVREPRARRASAHKTCHVEGGVLPLGSFVKIGEGVYVATPEYAYCLMARGQTYGASLGLAYEFCASYLKAPDDARGFRPHPPLSSVRLLQSYAGRGSRFRRLRPIVANVADGAASPMEAVLAALLCAPRVRGGFGNTLPQMNGLVDVSCSDGPLRAGTFYKCDLLWRRQKLAVEYDSDMFHTGADRIAHDSERRNALLAKGYSVVTVTRQQFFDELLFCEVGDQIAHALGKRVRPDREQYDWVGRYRALRGELLSAKGLRLPGA